MNNQRQDITSKATALVESHSLLATLLAVLCLVFAVNFFLTGPGSDGGSGFGGTGKFGGGESGFGGTGKTPDNGALKLGANDDDRDAGAQASEFSPLQDLREELERATISSTQIASLAVTPRPEFDVNILRLSPEAPAPVIDSANLQFIDELVAGVDLGVPESSIDSILQGERSDIAADTLVASLDILNNLILAETEASLQLAETALADTASDATLRQRVAVPVRPERPDRFSAPTRITPIQRVDVPAPPPVRPMRTLSTLLNR